MLLFSMSSGRKAVSDKKDWNTPPKLIQPITEFFGGRIDLDPCSNETSLVNARTSFVLPNKNGLNEKWNEKTIFVNPPYGRNGKTSIYNWPNKAVTEFDEDKQIIFLIPVATNTKHFKDLIFKHFSAICFLSDTRLKFYSDGLEVKKGAPMACCLCYLGKKNKEFELFFSLLWQNSLHLTNAKTSHHHPS